MSIKLTYIVGIFFIVSLIAFSSWELIYRTRTSQDVLIATDIQMLREIFQKIHQQCRITGFDAQKNPINFLNVKAFAGSELGSMNVAYPRQWQGPYVSDNPTMQDIPYQIINTKYGYFIMPGDGVILSNGKVIGKDIPTDFEADIPHMLQDPHMLQITIRPLFVSRKESLAAMLDLSDQRKEPVPFEEFLLNDDDV